MDSTEPKPINRVGLACIQCRSRHVKCDATQPTCNRCRRDGKECTYQKSRRGGLDKAALARRRLMLQQQAAQQAQENEGTGLQHHTSSPESGETTNQDPSLESSSFHDKNVLCNHYVPSLDNNPVDLIGSQLPASSNLAFQVSADRLVDLFYENFWPSVPITLPLPYLNLRKLNDNHDMENLLLVLQWIGAIYAPWTPSEPYYQAAHQILKSPTLPKDPWTIQALLLLSLAEYHYDFRSESRRSADRAIELALELRMNTREFARVYGEGNPVLEESWRRTYYFLAYLDQHLAVVVNNPVFALRDAPNNVDLPCDDDYYEIGQIPPTTTWQEYEMREFADVEIIYSSIVYLVDVSRIVTYIMREFTQTGTFSDSLIATVDAKVAVWKSLLPACKKDPMRQSGKIDEVMFMAHLIAAILILTSHRPFSSLAYSIEELSTESFVSPVPFIEPLKQGRGAHTARALQGVDIQTKLLAIPCPIERHSVLSLGIVASLATAQISACKILLEDHALSIARDRVRLSIGFLNAMGSIWPLSKKMAKEVRFIARKSLTNLPSTLPQEAQPPAEIEMPRDELIWPIDPAAQIDIYAGITMPVDWDPTMNYSSSSTSSIS